MNMEIIGRAILVTAIAIAVGMTAHAIVAAVARWQGLAP